ncbi:MAG: tRNA (adenosine(37)-N6)-threonylcarbamoyltransferase complex ATPase subunit type 1 TsaE [Eubacteriales bacterium]|nr:tRNA (adenosine(37)-N6)-threonylcarbamoyltransferase complex ATPase subunit type 1 TsaE [Eubacteriales bacterium]
MATLNIDSNLKMQALGTAFSKVLRKGDVVLLSGEMGSGKSEFARGVARGLGITGSVPSPTFTLLNVYDEGRVPLYHFDWYRIQDPEELLQSGLDEFIGTDGITLIEWHERASDMLPLDCVEISISINSDLTRTVSLTRHGDFRQINLEEVP